MVEVGATHLIFGWPWQFGVDAMYRGKLNQYVIQVGGSMIALVPLPSDFRGNEIRSNFLLQKQGQISLKI